ncbi:hypothetical protein WOLCODRAFT_22747 [Wolfiporia cocos MD-104 SS10]|uniref:Uncharacterized protein n=1 Tax=Wolfiporia cocos (strain MD-104) TaxID=742152 RepID=A0A2H3J5X8_WOLCO|nr:hypothetical protein WOLCODRAFT_22747 [Wolfiporia cocos MD-104 SS10]
MDPAAHHHDPSHQPTVPPTPSSSRKRSRENETPSQRHKREKAAERQRRKRERDRQAGLNLQNNILALSQVQQAGAPPVEQQAPLPSSVIAEYNKPDDASAEEAAKRDRVRAAARERQRKHRALVKARKMRELGMDMGNEIMPGMEDVQYRIGADGQYQPVMPHEMPPHPPPHHPMHEPPFPPGPPLGGQTFASTLLLSFSCAPLLKQHLLRTLNMTNEELASLEPIIAQAWDHWDQQRRMAYAHHAANGHKAPDGSTVQQDPNAPPYPPPPLNYVHDPSQGPPNDFRARFHRPLVAPSPFRSAIVGADSQQQPPPPASGSAAPGPSGEGMDPHLATAPGPGPGPGEPPRPSLLATVAGIDPQLGQARDEAAGVAGKLERA